LGLNNRPLLSHGSHGQFYDLSQNPNHFVARSDVWNHHKLESQLCSSRKFNFEKVDTILAGVIPAGEKYPPPSAVGHVLTNFNCVS